MGYLLEWEDLKPRADSIMLWWQTHKIKDEQLDHETRKRCGNVLYFLRKLERGESNTDVDFRFNIQNRIWEAEIWIKALEYKGD